MATPPNTIEASIAFDFRGERHAARLTLDLDRLMAQSHTLPSLHDLLAREIGIDPYSYQYEMLLAEDIRFARAQGMAAAFLHDECFDSKGFETAWREQRLLDRLQEIAQRRLAVNDLGQQPALRDALREAYDAGRQAMNGDAD